MQWKVGELARATGVTVRALHHYDEIGLLKPASRSGAGYRLYEEEDVRRLYRIVALRSLGLPLEEISNVMSDGDIEDTVRVQLARLDERIALAQQLRSRLERLLHASTDELIETIEVITMYEGYYTPEQLEQLAQRREQLGEEGMKGAERAWQAIAEGLEAARQAGADPGDRKVQGLIDGADRLIEQFTGGDPGIRESLTKLYEDRGAETASRGMFSSELMDYMARARAARES